MFTLAEMRQLVRTRPFVPFRVHLSDGGHVDVPHQELVLVGRRYAIVGLPEPGSEDRAIDRWTIVWYMHVTRVEALRASEPPLNPAVGGNGPQQESPL